MKRIFALVLAIATLTSLPASAGQSARAVKSSSTSTATWAVSAIGQSQIITYQPYSLTWVVTSGVAYDYFALRNIGSVPISNFFVAINKIRLSGNSNPNEIFFERCVGGIWSVSTNQCSGTVALIATASDASFVFSGINLSIGGEISMRARTQASNRNNFSTMLTTYVSRQDIRGQQVTNS